MPITGYGNAVRLARQKTKDTLLTMSEHLGKSIAFLSAIETGKSKIPLDFAGKVESYFNERGYRFEKSLRVLASVDNKNVGIDGLPHQQQMLVAEFAHSQYTPADLQKISALFNEINQGG